MDEYVFSIIAEYLPVCKHQYLRHCTRVNGFVYIDLVFPDRSNAPKHRLIEMTHAAYPACHTALFMIAYKHLITDRDFCVDFLQRSAIIAQTIIPIIDYHVRSDKKWTYELLTRSFELYGMSSALSEISYEYQFYAEQVLTLDNPYYFIKSYLTEFDDDTTDADHKRAYDLLTGPLRNMYGFNHGTLLPTKQGYAYIGGQYNTYVLHESDKKLLDVSHKIFGHNNTDHMESIVRWAYIVIDGYNGLTVDPKITTYLRDQYVAVHDPSVNRRYKYDKINYGYIHRHNIRSASKFIDSLIKK